MSERQPQAAAKWDLTSGSLGWNMFRLAGPMVVGQLLYSLYGLVDAMWLGRWAKTALASQAVCWPLFFFVLAATMGFGTAGTVLVSQHTGAGRHEDAARAAAQTLLLLGVLSSAVAAPLFILAPQLLRLMQVPADTVATAEVYLRISLVALPLVGFTIGYAAVLRALGDTVTVVIVGLVGNLVNLVLDPLLIFGWAGLPPMGAGGAALASVVGRSLVALICFSCLRCGRAGLRISLADLRPHWPTLKRMLAIGLPVALNRSSDSLGFVVFQTIINTLGTTVISAFTIGFRIIHFFNMPAHVVAAAAAPIVGQALGAGRPRLARRAVRSSATFVAGTLFVPLLFLLAFGKVVASAFTPDAEVIAEAGRFFTVVPLSSYLFGVLMVLMAAFYGSGHTFPAMVIGVLRLWVLRVPAAVLLTFVLGWGSLGTYWAMVIGNVCCAALALVLFLHGRWEKAVVPVHAESRQEEGGPSG